MRQAGRAVAALTTVIVVLTLGVSAIDASDAPPAAAATTGAASAMTIGPVQTSGTPVNVATGLDAPWSILQLHDADETVLVSERDTGVIERVTDIGGLDPLATVVGVHHINGGEGGLLGLATLVDGSTRWIYAYVSTITDNRIIRMVYNDNTPGDPAGATLGSPEVILSGLKAATNHNGGRIAFGPDGMLYATVGDTHDGSLSQKLTSLNGKILRMTPTGTVPADNPFPGSLIYSYGHRNPQGLAWDADGQLWESELGQNTWDEFNRIVPGGNYGWPIVEGVSKDHRFINPWQQWPTYQASPSGLAYVDGTFFMASLRGQRVWQIYVNKSAGTARSVSSYVNTLGRIRDVTAGPGGTLWILTNNTSRGVVRPGDDRIVQVGLIDTPRIDGVIDCATCAIPNGVHIDVILQRRSSGSWVTAQTVHLLGGPTTGTAFTFLTVSAGTYRVATRDVGAGGYQPTTSVPFRIATGQTRHVGTIQLSGPEFTPAPPRPPSRPR